MIDSDCMDFLLKNSPLNDVRIRQWERLYPGCTDDFEEIFGTYMPSTEEVASWKMSWYERTPHYMAVEDAQPSELVINPGLKEEIYQTCHASGIHPYFWEYWVSRETRWFPDNDHTEHRIEPRVSFFHEQHLVMFKLAWRNL